MCKQKSNHKSHYLYKHIYNTHCEIRYKCRICNFIGSSEWLEEHTVTNQYYCEICSQFHFYHCDFVLQNFFTCPILQEMIYES